MGRQYSLKNFLRKTPNALLRQYFDKLDIGAEISWQQLTETRIEPIYRAIEYASEEVRVRIGRDFQDIHEMADEGGTKTLIDEGRDRHHNIDLPSIFEPLSSHVEKAMWCFIEHPNVFSVARRFRHADRLGRWKKRKDLPDAEPSTDEEATNGLAEAISAYYLKQEGRGRGCQADHYARDSRLYWFVYPEDYAEGRLVYDDEHELRLETQRPAFEIVFVYDVVERSLEINAAGDKSTTTALQGLFSSIILGVPPDLPDRSEVVYELDGLLSPDFPLPVHPGDGVDDVTVKALRLELPGLGNPRLTLEINPRDGEGLLYTLLHEMLKGTDLSPDAVRVTRASFRLQFRPEDGGRGRTLTFDVSHPDSCSLKHEPRHDIAKTLLKRWGIDVSGRSADGSELPERTVQRTLQV